MPIFVIYTNTPKTTIPDSFLPEATAFLAKQLGKPESYVQVRVSPEQIMSHGGSTDPCGCVEVHSIGALGPKNPDHALAIGQFIEEKLKISKDRFYICFVEDQRENVALSGKTFAQ